MSPLKEYKWVSILCVFLCLLNWSCKSESDVKTLQMENLLPRPQIPNEYSYLAGFKTHKADIIFENLDGEKKDFRDFKGAVVFMNFWATWCTPCVAEMPSIQRLYEMCKKDGIQFFIVSSERRDLVKTFVAKHALQVPVYTMSGMAPFPFKTPGIPATFVIDREGKIAYKHIGAAQWDDPSFLDFIRGL